MIFFLVLKDFSWRRGRKRTSVWRVSFSQKGVYCCAHQGVDEGRLLWVRSAAASSTAGFVCSSMMGYVGHVVSNSGETRDV